MEESSERSRWLAALGLRDVHVFGELSSSPRGRPVVSRQEDSTRTHDGRPIVSGLLKNEHIVNDVPVHADDKLVDEQTRQEETSTLQDLEIQVKQCQRCSLHKTRNHVVFSRGSSKATWMLIGEAPGASEDQWGLPFVGRAGRLLDAILTACALDREQDVYITNVLKCRPPGNRNPEQAEIVSCQPYLWQQVDHVQPDVLIALGRFAAQTLLHSTESISRLRGRVHRVAKRPLIVTFHPAYLLRNPVDKRLAWEDWCLAKSVTQASC